MATRTRHKAIALPVSWGYRTKRQVSKVWNDGRIGARLGTLSPSQHSGSIRELYQNHWEILKPSSFLIQGDKTTHTHTIAVKNQYLIPRQVVERYLAGKKPRTKEKAIQKAISTLDESGQAVCFHAVIALLGLDGMTATRQYVHSILKDDGFEKAFSRAKAPFWIPKANLA